MLKKIALHEVRLGMYLQSLEGSWLDSPFWPADFLLTEPDDFDALLHSGLPAVWIDTARGLDVVTEFGALDEGQVGQASAAPPAQPQTMCQEMAHAARVLKHAHHDIEQAFNEVRMGFVLNGPRCVGVAAKLVESVQRNPYALVSLARLKRPKDYTYMHSVGVGALMAALALQLGMDAAQTQEAALAGLLHDLGKMTLPAALLDKPSALDAQELQLMRQHPAHGKQCLHQDHPLPRGVRDTCHFHHEKFDGSGYPENLAGEQIPLLARMAAICDVYDALTAVRPYKAAWDPAMALARMGQWTGHFDPVLFQVFVRCVGIYPVGTLVKLASGRLAVVVEQTTGKLSTPIVKLFYSSITQQPIAVELLDLAHSSDRIVGRENAPDWGFEHLESLWLYSENE